eukprot:GHUV01035205.1.p1 GENE.GHUV01035205.1~~GHUV01035205.1.p1  ORF type:complete len:192 (+),score=40.02 GHUV01035205.1:192-767(+)
MQAGIAHLAPSESHDRLRLGTLSMTSCFETTKTGGHCYISVCAHAQAAYDQIDFAALEQDVQQVAATCSMTHSPVVFGHNDLLSGNILVLQQPGFDPEDPDREGPVGFIDYEYGAYTYRGFDIGNHFTEYAGFEGDYTRCEDPAEQGRLCVRQTTQYCSSNNRRCYLSACSYSTTASMSLHDLTALWQQQP